MEQKGQIHEFIKSLVDLDVPFPARWLYHLSDLSPADRAVLASAWSAIPLQRRRALLQDLVALAEHDSLLLFEEVGRIALEDGDTDVLLSAIDLLFEAEDKRLIPAFLHLLTSPSREDPVRAAAANALGPYVYLGELDKLRKEQLLEIETALLQAYNNDASDLVRRRALESLGFSCREDVPALLRAAAFAQDENWLESALFAMGRSADEQWETIVLDNLDHDNPLIAAQAIHAAGELALDKARRRLLKKLDQNSDPEIRKEIIWALSQIGGEGIEEKFEALLERAADDEEAALLEEGLNMLAFTSGDDSFDLMDVPYPEEEDLRVEGGEEEEDELERDFDEEEWRRYVDDDDDFDDDAFMDEDEDDFDDTEEEF